MRTQDQWKDTKRTIETFSRDVEVNRSRRGKRVEEDDARHDGDVTDAWKNQRCSTECEDKVVKLGEETKMRRIDCGHDSIEKGSDRHEAIACANHMGWVWSSSWEGEERKEGWKKEHDER